MSVINKSFFSKVIAEFGPIAIFVALFEYSDFFTATKGMLIATCLSLVYSYYKQKRIPLFPVLVTVFTLFFGIITIAFHNPKILMLRDSVYDLSFACAIFIGLFRKKNVLKFLFSDLYEMSDEKWKVLSYMWGMYFCMGGIFNEIIRHNGTVDFWVTYKIFMVFITIFVGAISIYIARPRDTFSLK
jgi:intracellular septation protein